MLGFARFFGLGESSGGDFPCFFVDHDVVPWNKTELRKLKKKERNVLKATS